jgi:hypothetical protein
MASDQRVGVCNGRHHLGDACPDQGVATRARAALVSAGLQRYIGGGSPHIVPAIFRILQRHHFGMRPPSALREACAQHLYPIGRNDHAPHAGVGIGNKKRLGGEPKRLVHEVGRCLDHRAR